MDIDLNQLPIPDWGLTCPGCNYPLVGLPEHRCPECGRQLDMNELVQTWTRLRGPRVTGEERPIPAWGIRCPRCERLLDGESGTTCPGCGGPIDGEALRPRRDWFVLDESLADPVPLPSVEIVLAREGVPYFRAGEKKVREIYMGPRMIGARLMVPSEFYFEVRMLLHEAAKELEQGRTHRDEAEWNCPSCGETVPANFEVCWNCGAPPDA